jgi:hypothetical protein
MIEEATLLRSRERFELLFAATNIQEVVPILDMALDQVFEQTVGFARTTDAKDEIEQAVVRGRKWYVPVLRNDSSLC